MPRPENPYEPAPGSHPNQPARIEPAAAAIRPWSEGRTSNGPRAATRPAPSSTPDPMGMLIAFRRRWLLALSLGLVAMVTAGAAAYNFLPQAKYYTASSIYISSLPPRVFMGTNEQVQGPEAYRQNQLYLLKSPSVLKIALANPRVARLKVVTDQLDPKKWLQEELKIKSGGEFVELGMFGDNPEEVEIIVNAVTDAYKEFVIDGEKARRQDQLEKLQTHWTDYHKKVREKREQIRRMATQLGSNDPVSIQAANQWTQERLATLQQEMAKVDQELLRDTAKLKFLSNRDMESTESADPGAIAAAEPAPGVGPRVVTEAQLRDVLEQDAYMRGYREEERKAQASYEKSARVNRNKMDPSVSGPRQQLAAIRSKIKAREEQVREFLANQEGLPQGAAGINSPSATPEDEVARLKATLAFNKTYKESIEALINATKAELKTTTSTFIDLTTEQEEVAAIGDLTRKLGAEIEGRNLEKSAGERIEIRARAEIPKVKENSAKHMKMCLAAAGGAFIFAVMSVSFWEFRARRVNSIDEVVTGLGLNLVGALPALPTRKLGRRADSQALEDRAWQNMLVESVDATRTMLLHMSRVEGLRSVMICSAMKGEGKTSLSVHLATSLARAGQRTLLIDCDLRSPSVNKLYDLAVDPGLCEYLRGEAELADVIVNVIRQAPVGGLDLIPAGRYDAIALQSLARDGVRNLIEVVGEQYDFVIVDSAPILPVADTLLLSQQVDAVLFSILREVSRLHHVHAAHERVANLGVRILGAVVNGAPKTSTYGMYPYS